MKYIRLMFLTITVFLSNSAHADGVINYNWDGDYLNFTIVNLNTNVETLIDCGNAISGYKCYIQLVHIGSSKDEVIWSDPVNIKGKQQVKEVVFEYSTLTLPKSGKIYKPNSDDCIYAYLSGKSGGYYLLASTCDGTLPPLPPQPEKVFCSLNNDIVLDHGPLSKSNVNGNKITQQGTFQCTGSATVKITAKSMSGQSYITLDEKSNFKSYLTINDVDGSTGITLKVTNFNVPITFDVSSTLIGAPIDSGEFSGNGLLILSII